jgi:hypothetical protein
MRKFFNLFAIAAGAVLVAALGVSAHAQMGSVAGSFTRAGVHSQLTTERSERSEVGTEARESEPTEEPEVEQEQAEPAEAPEAPETETDNQDNHNNSNDDQGENTNTQTSGGDDSHDGSGGD